MHPDETRQLTGALILGLPVAGWAYAVSKTETLAAPKLLSALTLIHETPHKPWLMAGAAAGLVLAFGSAFALRSLGRSEFGGAEFTKWLRGTQLVTPAALRRRTHHKSRDQVDVAGIEMPLQMEDRHMLISGSTGSGKSVLLRQLALSAMMRGGDRMVILDPNGDLYSKFGRPGDHLLNPYDARTKAWSIFNEMRNDYDFQRYALSLVPRGETKEAEEWRGYARVLVEEVARKLKETGNPSIRELYRWTNIRPDKELQAFLKGTTAEGLFVGADKALASARFVLTGCIPPHLKMPDGRFSIRDWLEDPTAGNLFITWREDMAEGLKPLISAWADVVCTSVLSLPEDPNRRIWLMIDELASMEKLASLEAAATKGRKHGLRLIAGLQSTAQLEDIYGANEAQTLRSCFRSLVVLSGAKSDPKTCEDMSKALGEHEVERESYSTSHNHKGPNRSRQYRHDKERVVMASEIAALPDLVGYVSFASDYPIAKVKLEYTDYLIVNPPFIPRMFEGAAPVDEAPRAPPSATPVSEPTVMGPA